MSEPVDEKLYSETKKKVDEIYDKPSAYRSMAYSRFYLRAFREKYGLKKVPYKGKRPGELEKWRREKWIDIRSFLDTPEDPKACGAIEYGKKEYPLCMPISKAKRYDKQELSALLYRKSELGKSRLVKEPYLRDLYGKPIVEVKIKDIKPLQEPKKTKEAKFIKAKVPKTVKQVEAAKTPEPVQPIERRPTGRPRKERTEQEITAMAERERRITARKQGAEERRKQVASRREDKAKRLTERVAVQPSLPSGITEGFITRTPAGTISFA